MLDERDRGKIGRTISKVRTEGLGRVALATRLTPSSRGGRSNRVSVISKPVKLLRAG